MDSLSSDGGVGPKFADDEIVVLAYLAKYNCKDLGYRYNSEIYRRLEEIFGRKTKSSKTKYENIVNEYYRANVPRETKSYGTSGGSANSDKDRWTERSRWKEFLKFEKNDWLIRSNEILERNPGVGYLLPKTTLPLGLKPDGESLIKRSNSSKGWLYVLSHPSFEGWIKIGKTRNLSSRLSSYNTGTPNRNSHYKLEYSTHFKIFMR